jgi:fibronectin type 3 domain-containing protein
MADLIITFNEPVPAPSLGYLVKYREKGTVMYTTLSPNPSSSPVTITVPSGKNWEGTVQAVCDDSSLSMPQSFSVDTPPTGGEYSSFQARFSTDEFNVCAQPETTMFSQEIVGDGAVIQGAVVYFDNSGLNNIGNGYIVDTVSGMIFVVENGVVGAPTGNSCN